MTTMKAHQLSGTSVLLPSSKAAAARFPRARCLSSRRIVVMSASPEFAGRQFTILSTGEAATAHLASMLAEEARPGDAYCCKGDERAGKSTFCAAFVRAAHQNGGMHVAPPTQTLQPNVYAGYGGPDIHHLDLHYLDYPGDAAVGALAQGFTENVSLVEWAERLQQWGAAPEQRLALWFRRLPDGAMGASPDAPLRLITVIPHSASWEVRAGLLAANLGVSGAPQGLVVLSDDLAASMTRGLPEAAYAMRA